MEEDQHFSDAELRYGLLRHMDSARDVEPPLSEELLRRGHLAGPPGSVHVTASGKRFLGLETPLDENVKEVVLASQLLRHVIAVAAERTTPDGGRIVVTSVEVWSHEVVVQWTEICTAQPLPGDRSDPFESMSLTDDLGTTYTRVGAGGGGGSYTHQMCARFLGAPADTASALFLVPPKADGREGPIRIGLP